MDGSVKSDATLEVSVSFGRFENDALSWEKWSTFSPNKYLEEVGSLSTRGSVAQKKAYFEAHYKKIAAKKAEELEHEENSMYPIIPMSNVARKENNNEISPENGIEHGSSNGQRLVAGVTEEPCDAVSSDASETDINASFSNGERLAVEALCNVNTCDEAKGDHGVTREMSEQGESLNGLIHATDPHEGKLNDAMESIEEIMDHSNGNAVGPKLDSREEAKLSSKKVVEKIPLRKKVTERSNASKKEKPKLNSRNSAQKVTPIKEKDSAASKKKVVTPSFNKLLQAPNTYRQPKPTMMSTSLSSAQSLKKTVPNSSALPKSKSLAEGKIKRTPTTSLHMSISLGPTNPSLSDSPTRKSLIMEKMGDKGIVKRAFKAFQNRGVSADKKQGVSSPSSEPKVAASRTPAKGNNEGLKKDAKKPATPKSNSMTRSNPLPSRKSLTTPSPASALRSNGSAEKRREFVKKLETRSIARVTESTRTLAKSKQVEKISGVNRLTQSLNFKGKSMPSFNDDDREK